MKFLTITLCLIMFCTGVFAQGSYAVLMQESPAGAGEIQPGIGVHTFGVNETVTLNTVPKMGYHFVYWLGDVSDPAANRTTMSVDGPKIVIAVFVRDSYELPSANAAVCQGPEGLWPTSYSNSAGEFSENPDPEQPDYPDYPDNPVPEPGTIILLSAGVLMLHKKLLKKN
jgi:hypothetical protein